MGTTTNYTYDENNTRVYFGSATSSVVYPNRLYNRNATTTKTTHQVFLGDLLVATIESATSTGTTTYYVHTDHLGGTSVITNASGTAVQVSDYYPYGGERINTQTNGFKEQRKYAGTEYDPDSAYNFMEARYYDSGRGSFISQDPTFLSLGDPSRLQALTGRTQESFLADPQQLNSYNYARGNPIIYKDPNGLCPQCILGAIGGLASFGSTWAGDIMQNRAEGKTGLDAYAFRQSAGVYAYNTLTGAASAAFLPTSLLASGLAAVSISVVEDSVVKGERVDFGKALVSGGTSVVTGGLFRGLAGNSPLEKSLANQINKKIGQKSVTDGLRYTATKEAFQSSVGTLTSRAYTTYSNNQSLNQRSSSFSGSLSSLKSALSSLAKALSGVRTSQ